jgi:hypothetical protein
MNGSYVIIFVISLAIFFTIDPTPTVPEDTTDFHFSLSASDNNKNAKNDVKKIQVTKHVCPKCISGSLTFEGTNAGEGKLIHTINCTCGFKWQEMWALTNWPWLKSSSPYDHWTSKR